MAVDINLFVSVMFGIKFSKNRPLKIEVRTERWTDTTKKYNCIIEAAKAVETAYVIIIIIAIIIIITSISIIILSYYQRNPLRGNQPHCWLSHVQ